jgi:malate synthase
MRDIAYYKDFLTDEFLLHLKEFVKPVPGVSGLEQIGDHAGLETPESLQFLCELYELTKDELNAVLNRRQKDRTFIDQQTKAAYDFNRELKRDWLDPDYKTILGLTDSEGRIVIGPKNEFYAKAGGGKPIAPIPDFLQGNHVTLFGPPDDTKLSINAMNAYHRKLKDEPKVVQELLSTQTDTPKWGADDEDSKTPLRSDLQSAGMNLTECFEGTIGFTDARTGKKYELEKDHLSLPIKRFPGLALPSFFLFSNGNPMPLHLYDFALHLFKNWHNEKALAFYVPKLENEEEARYIKNMIATAEKLIQKKHSAYKTGTIRLMIVLENPRAVFRANEIIDELYPYFVGASLGWHDYLASTARLFKEDANYRIPVKADPNIVIKYIKASHNLLADVVGTRGGIKVGGMYGILPVTTDLKSPSFQVTMKGYIKDVITQFKRDLTGFWVAHPDFVRLGLALVEGWKQYKKGDKEKLERLVRELLDVKYHKEILDFIAGPDIGGLDINDPLYPRKLIVADIKESDFIANNHPDEIRYNVFQSLQYITDWLTGNGCVALPADINDIPVRVMDDLATAERSRWEVWHEIRHGRFSVQEFLKIAHEEYNFIRKDLSDEKKIVQVKWDARTEKWYPVAMNLMIKLMTDASPVEFATEYLLPFTVPHIRKASDPWSEVSRIDPVKFKMDPAFIRFNYYFSMCGSEKFAGSQSINLVMDLENAKACVLSFDKKDILEAASFHGDIGEGRKTLDHMAVNEQKLVFDVDESIKEQLRDLGAKYKQKFGMKFLVSAKDKSGQELLEILKTRINNSEAEEINNARSELWKITEKRMKEIPLNSLSETISAAIKKHKIQAAQVSITTSAFNIQDLTFGANKTTWFELASLSKTVASAFAIEYFAKKKISLDTKVNSLLEKSKSTFRLKSSDASHSEWADKVTIAHLMSHYALNMHYVNGVPADKKMPPITEFLNGNETYGYAPVSVANEPGTKFQYSGGGFIVLEHLIEALEEKPVAVLTREFLDKLGMKDFSFAQENIPGHEYTTGFSADGKEIVGKRKMFPAFAAGSMGTAHDMNVFLNHLTKAFRNSEGSEVLSHDTAVKMLYGRDFGCQKFMGSEMGLGVFIATAGMNKIAIHQGANDGFRCLYLHCFDGPNIGQGFTLLCNAELNGVLFISEVAQKLLKEMQFEGIDFKKFNYDFELKNIPQEEVVNIGYKKLIFDAFSPMLPESIIDKGPRDPLASYNLAVDAEIIEVTNQKFARAENLLSTHLPVFDPNLFGKQGKIMDSWETVRHNPLSCDTLLLNLKKPSTVKYISVSTKYHLGNQAQFIKIEGRVLETGEWIELLPKTNLEGHALYNGKSSSQKVVDQIRVSNFPDGGISRLGLYNELPAAEIGKFNDSSEKFVDDIPKTIKPLAAPYAPGEIEIKKNWSKIKKGELVDVASLAFGGKLIHASNEHYGPAIQTISPYSPMHMFDGFESARSRVSDHTEEIILQLACPSVIEKLVLDFSFFVNNNPREIKILGLSDKKWITLVDVESVKAFAGNKREFLINCDSVIDQIKVVAIPDGGINRIKAYSRKLS